MTKTQNQMAGVPRGGSRRARQTKGERAYANRRFVGGLRLVGLGGRGTAMSKHSRHYRTADGSLVAWSATKQRPDDVKARNRRRNKQARRSRLINRGSHGRLKR